MVIDLRQRALAVAVTSFVVFSPTRAHAADDFEKARATGLVAEARALAEAGKLQEACVRFEESVALHEGDENQYELAECWEKIGRTASAYAMFLKVVDKSRELGQHERETAAAERADALATKLIRLRVEVKAPAEGLELTQNDKPIARKDWGRPIPVDPGIVELRATAVGRQPWHEKLTLPSEPGTVVAWVPPLAEKPLVPTPEKSVPEEEPVRAAEKSSSSFRTIATIGLLGVGGAGIVVGSIMGAKYAMNNSDAKDICPSGIGCTEHEIARHEQLVEDARTARTWSLVGFSVGAAGLAGAAVVYLTAPNDEKRADAPWLRARVFVTREGAVTGALQGGF